MATESSNRALSFDVAARGGPRQARSVSPDYQMSLATILKRPIAKSPRRTTPVRLALGPPDEARSDAQPRIAKDWLRRLSAHDCLMERPRAYRVTNRHGG